MVAALNDVLIDQMFAGLNPVVACDATGATPTEAERANVHDNNVTQCSHLVRFRPELCRP